jgi:hypothetical protein
MVLREFGEGLHSGEGFPNPQGTSGSNSPPTRPTQPGELPRPRGYPKSDARAPGVSGKKEGARATDPEGPHVGITCCSGPRSAFWLLGRNEEFWT